MMCSWKFGIFYVSKDKVYSYPFKENFPWEGLEIFERKKCY